MPDSWKRCGTWSDTDFCWSLWNGTQTPGKWTGVTENQKNGDYSDHFWNLLEDICWLSDFNEIPSVIVKNSQGIHHHHHVVPLAWISLTLPRHFTLSFIASGRSSGLHPVSSHSCCMYVRAGRPAFARPYVGVT